MNKRQFYIHQLVQTTHLNDIQQINQDYLERYGAEVVGIDNFVFNGLETIATDPASMKITLKEGSGWKSWKNIYHPEDIEIDINPADTTYPRIDTIAVKYSTRELILENLIFRNPLPPYNTYNEQKLAFITDYREILYIPGIPEEIPVAPDVPEDALGSSHILVVANATDIAQEDITDIRVLKQEYLVGDHRTKVPIDHPPLSIDNSHISNTADISLIKLSGIDYDNLYELIYFDTNLCLAEEEDYIYDASDRLTQINYPRRALQEKYFYDEMTGRLTYTTLENAKWIYREDYNFSGFKIVKIVKTIIRK